MLPASSIFLSGRPWYEILLPFLFGILTAFVMLHLAWISIGRKIPLRKSIWPAVILGLVPGLARQMLSAPYHQFITLVIMVFLVQIFGQVKILRAITATIFVQVVVILSNILIGGPVLLLLKPKSMTINEFTAIPFSAVLGTVAESLLPVVVLWLFWKFKITLIGRSQNDSGNSE